jgi:hypothetical protein
MDHVSHDAVEQLAALILVIGGGIFIALSFRARPIPRGSSALRFRPRRSAGTTADAGSAAVRRSLTVIMAGLSGGAAVIHVVAAPGHYAEIGDLASGFLVAAAFQGAWIRWCLAGPSPRAAAIGIAGNLAIVAAWAWTRTIGLPIGELAGSPEPVGYPDLASVVFELLLVSGLVIRLLELDVTLARRAAVPAIASVAIVPVIGLVLILTSLATVAIASGLGHGAPDGHPATEHVAAP